MVILEKIEYSDLNAKAKEMYNFQKASAILADYGFTTMWLNNDWKGADFIAIHIDGVTDIKVQLKGRLSFSTKYIGKDIYMCFIENNVTYLYPHDEILNLVEPKISDKKWRESGIWSTSKLSTYFKEILTDYTI